MLSTKAYCEERQASIEGKDHAWTQHNFGGTSRARVTPFKGRQLISTRLCYTSSASWPMDAVTWTVTPSSFRFRIPGTGSGVGRPKPRHLIRVFRELSRECLPNSPNIPICSLIGQEKGQESRGGGILDCGCDFAARNATSEMSRMVPKTTVGGRKNLLRICLHS